MINRPRRWRLTGQQNVPTHDPRLITSLNGSFALHWSALQRKHSLRDQQLDYNGTRSRSPQLRTTQPALPA